MNANAPQFSPELGHDEIALSAFLAWEKDGCPHGNDLAYWFQAEGQLRALKQKKFAARPISPPPAPSRPLASKPAVQKLTTNVERKTTVKPTPSAQTTPSRAAQKTKLKSTR